jgi:hypothetical protein
MRLNRSVRVVLLASLLSAGVAAKAQATNIVLNGSFETGDFTNWTQTGNTTFNGVQCPGPGPTVAQGNCSAFFGPVGSTGGIQQTMATSVGAVYFVNFGFLPDGSNPSSFSAVFGGTTLLSLTNPPASAAYQFFSFGVTATSANTTLQFNFRDDPGFLFLDRVEVLTTPEPATLSLLGLGLAAVARMRRRSTRK